MPDWLPVAVRFALYLDLGLAFGWPLFCLYAARRAGELDGESQPAAPVLLLGIAGLLLSGLGFWVQIAAMAGTSLAATDPTLAATMIRETTPGWAFAVRMSALLLVVGAGLAGRGRFALTGAAAAGAVALASLAWNGHAGAAEGGLAPVQLGADLLHLWSAGLWLGALAGLLRMVAARVERGSQLIAAQRALEGFSLVGTLAVATLVATGAVNTVLLVGAASWASLLGSTWSRLLAVKLLLFGVMLLLAAANRFRLTPGLEAAIATGETRNAVVRLRASLAAETVMAGSILGLVAWLGTLAPPASG